MNRMTIFNPEHDMALANGDCHFIAPRNIREMAHDLAPLMDIVEGDDMLVWGWDSSIKQQLLRMGVPEDQLPTDDSLTALRTYSERQSAHHWLHTFRAEHPEGSYTGESILAHNIDDIALYAEQHGHIVLKDPLSSSGKGLRHVNGLPLHNTNQKELSPFKGDERRNKETERRGYIEASNRELTLSLKKVESWANALIRRHGYLTAEPYYNKVQDFAMEFHVADGQCRFIGYSLFTTNAHGRYEGNRLMADEKIETLLAQYIPHSALHEVRDWVISHYSHIIPSGWDTTKNPLYFGIDMMVVSLSQQTTFNCQLSTLNSQLRIHPCVEINLRLNMGIIAHEVYRKLLAPDTEGTFHVTAFPTEEAARQFGAAYSAKYPPKYHEGKIVSGYHPLTPVLPHTRHHAYVICRATCY